MPLIACFHIDMKYMTTITVEQINFIWNNYKKNIGLKGMRYYGGKLWKNIYLNCTDINSIYSFRVRFKNMLLDNNMLEEKLVYCIWWWEMYHSIKVWNYYYLEGLPKYKEVQFNKNITNSALVYSVIQNVYKNIR